jgi:outer membrane biosynthesis protein TonB
MAAPSKPGNTYGRVSGETGKGETVTAANPIRTSQTPKEKSWWDNWGEKVHTALDIGGAIPVVGIFSDAINAGIYTAEGNYVEAAISGVSAAANLIPGGGIAAKGTKLAVKAGEKALVKAVEKQVVKETVEQTAKVTAKETVKATEKKVAEEVVEATAKKTAKKAEEKAAKDTKIKPKEKPKPDCGKTGPYKANQTGHDNAGMNWDHVPSVAALLKAAKKATGKDLSKEAKQAIKDNAPTVAIPTEAHQKESRTYGGRQNTKNTDGLATKEVDSKDLQKATKEDTKKMGDNIEKYDKGCGGAYKKAAEELTKRSHADWGKWLKDIVKEADKVIKK